ncbi:hypothetical protein [Aureimonas sp. N4]|uniref:hypothetical protein n=1 Tax=Aureimonas sp. N4 TaxID=1638165 RepID=UPI000AD49883|nr:hypothetical protein [Aureimonas sp. N4]
MLDRTNTTVMVRRLLSAVLLCLSVVLSQMAHASVPFAPMAGAQSTHSVAADNSDGTADHRDRASGHAHGDRDGHPKAGDHTGPSDTKCASHCPAVFVPTGTDTALRIWLRQDARASVHASLTGLRVPTADRPPRT